MVSARAKQILRRIYKTTKPGLKSYGKKLGTYVDAEVARRTAGTSFAGLVPEVSTFYPAEGSGLSLAGRGLFRKSRVRVGARRGTYLPIGITSQKAFNPRTKRLERIYLKRIHRNALSVAQYKSHQKKPRRTRKR